jgi:hypothetical protein
MSNLTTSARLADPLRQEYLTVEEEDDWRDRGSKTELTTPLWHGEHGDFGALTRFGLGWGPLEVQRTRREVVTTDRLRRVLTVLIAGKPAVQVVTSGEHLDEVTIIDDEVDELETPGTATRLDTVKAPVHVRYDERQYAHDDVTPPLDAYDGNGHGDTTSVADLVTPTSGDGDAPDASDALRPATVDHLRRLSATIQEHLTPARRKSKYVSAAVLTNLDELDAILNGDAA